MAAQSQAHSVISNCNQGYRRIGPDSFRPLRLGVSGKLWIPRRLHTCIIILTRMVIQDLVLKYPLAIFFLQNWFRHFCIAPESYQFSLQFLSSENVLPLTRDWPAFINFPLKCSLLKYFHLFFKLKVTLINKE